MLMANDLFAPKLWLEMTDTGVLTRRSTELRAVDAALQKYDRAPTLTLGWEVTEALEKWKKSKGTGQEWRRSARNKKGAVDQLTQALDGKKELSAQEKLGIKTVEDAQIAYIRTLFDGRRVALSSKALTAYQSAGAGKTVDSLVAAARQSDSALAIAGHEVRALVHSALGEASSSPDLAVVLMQVIGKSLDDLVTSITPAVGLVKSASMTLYQGVVTAAKAKQLYDLHGAEVGFAAGDPEAAFLAVRELVKRELAKSGLQTTTYAGETAAKSAGIFLDGGTATTVAVGIAATLARLMITLNALRVDLMEMRAANAILQEPDTINASLFAKNPLLGCYFLVCADTSTIVNFMFKDLGRSGFMYEVEKACAKHLDPTLKIASHLILGHRMVLSGAKLSKLSVETASGKATAKIAIRDPSTVMNVKAKVVNTLRRRDDGFYK